MNKLAIFDLDGTLFDTGEVNFFSYQKALNKVGYDVEKKYYIEHCNGYHYKRFLPTILKDLQGDELTRTMEEVHLYKKDYYKDEVKASHILISTVDDNGKELSEAKKKEAKKKAEEVLKKAKSGEEFSELAKEYSDDKGSAENGGDLGYFTKGQMVQPFEEAAFSLKPGEISGIVESQYGYHIIKVYDKIDEQLPFNDVKDEIKNILIEDKYVASIEDISKKAKVEKHENIVKKVNF